MRDLLILSGVWLDAPAVTFTDPIMTALGKLRDMLASSASFQTWTGSVDATAAKNRIHFFVVPETEMSTRPYALLSIPGGGIEFRRIAGGAASFFAVRGRARIDFEDDIDPADTPQLAEETFVDEVEAALGEVLALAGVDSNLPLEHVERVGGPWRSDHDEDEDYYRLSYEAPWGIDAA